MSDLILYPRKDWKRQAVVNRWLTTDADGESYRVAHYKLHPIRVFSIWNALRSKLSWIHSPVHWPPIFYTLCSKFTYQNCIAKV
jgi:hypothetical protein